MRILSILLLGSIWACQPTKPSMAASGDFLCLSVDTIKGEYGYLNPKGEAVIPFGKYPMCFTDTFRTHAVVINQANKLVAIDRTEKELFDVFMFDNGPDYPSEGLFRISKNSKIGYADANTFQIVIPPQFECAYPFENGLAKVSLHCSQVEYGEHAEWKSDQWIFIDHQGKTIRVSK